MKRSIINFFGLTFVSLALMSCEGDKENKIIDITYVVYYPQIQDTVKKSYICDSSHYIYTESSDGVNIIRLGRYSENYKYIYKSSAPFKILSINERENPKYSKSTIKNGETIEYPKK